MHNFYNTLEVRAAYRQANFFSENVLPIAATRPVYTALRDKFLACNTIMHNVVAQQHQYRTPKPHVRYDGEVVTPALAEASILSDSHALKVKSLGYLTVLLDRKILLNSKYV